MKTTIFLLLQVLLLINVVGCHSNTNKTIQKNPAEMNLGYKFDSSYFMADGQDTIAFDGFQASPSFYWGI